MQRCKRTPGSLLVEKRLDASNFGVGRPKRGWHPPFSTYYCCWNTQMPEEKSWNEHKVLQYSNTTWGINGIVQNPNQWGW